MSSSSVRGFPDLYSYVIIIQELVDPNIVRIGRTDPSRLPQIF